MRIGSLAVLIFFFTLSFESMADVTGNNNDDFLKALEKAITRFESAYNLWEEERFATVNEQFRHIASKWPHHYLPHYWQGVVHFHLVSYTLFGFPEHRDKKAAKKYVEKALDALDDALELQPGDAECLALSGTLTGIKIFLKPLQAPVLGPRVMDSMKKALEADSTNPRVQYLAGVSYYNTPALLGGGVDKGLPYLLKAEELYRREAAKSSLPDIPRWGHSTCLGFIGKAYTKKKNYTSARRWYGRALDVNPSDKMAKKGLEQLDSMNSKSQIEN